MRPPVDLHAEIALPNGDRIRWDPSAQSTENRVLSPAFETESGRGFGSGSVTLRRPINRDYPDLGLLNELTLRSATGTIVYQGRARGIPVSDEFTVDCDGWWGYAEQREITDLILDRDASAWTSTSLARKAFDLTVDRPHDVDYQAETKTGAIIFSGTTGKSVLSQSKTELVYYAPPGCRISAFQYKGTQRNLSNVLDPFIYTSGRADLQVTNQTVLLTLDNTTRTATFTNRPLGLILEARASSTHTPSVPFSRTIYPAVYGESGVPIENRGDGLTGFRASDAIRYIANKWLPKLDTSEVQPTDYLIPQGAWGDPITPGDAIRQMNAYHLWKLGIWEERRLTFAPYDLSVADWQVQAGIDGVRVDYQGDTTENVFNGVAVTYTDITTGRTERLTPNESEDLRDRSDYIAANQWGDEAWLNIAVSWPTIADDAVEIGRVALANANQARRPSTITVPAYIQDMNGTYWPSSYVRADQTIVVTNQHSAVPRLITRTSWSDHSLTITTDDAIDTMEAFNQRISGALSSRGLI